MRPDRVWKIVRFVITTGVIFIVWLLFSGSFDGFSLVAGLAGSILISALTYDVFIARDQANLRFFLPRPVFLVIYLGVLVAALMVSSVTMLRAVISGAISPRVVHFRTRLRSDLARMVLANSITLTPGTMTLDLNDDHLTVHWLFCHTTHSGAAGDVVKGRLEKHLRKVWL